MNAGSRPCREFAAPRTSQSRLLAPTWTGSDPNPASGQDPTSTGLTETRIAYYQERVGPASPCGVPRRGREGTAHRSGGKSPAEIAFGHIEFGMLHHLERECADGRTYIDVDEPGSHRWTVGVLVLHTCRSLIFLIIRHQTSWFWAKMRPNQARNVTLPSPFVTADMMTDGSSRGGCVDAETYKNGVFHRVFAALRRRETRGPRGQL